MRNQMNRRSPESHRRRGGYDNFIRTVEKQLTDHPQIGAVVLDGLVLACNRLAEMLMKFEEQLREKVEELRDSSFEQPMQRQRSQSKSGIGSQTQQ